MIPSTLCRIAAAGRVALLAVALAVAASGAFAGDAVNAPGGLALHGFDPVAYFTEGRPVQGDTVITADHRGATYRFASATNRDAFAKSPDKYVPQYGGWCAYGVALGKKFDIDPASWRIVDGKLYLNLNPDIFKKWQADVPTHIAQANGNWPKIRDKEAGEL